jgi:hypothetical protein
MWEIVLIAVAFGGAVLLTYGLTLLMLRAANPEVERHPCTRVAWAAAQTMTLRQRERSMAEIKETIGRIQLPKGMTAAIIRDAHERPVYHDERIVDEVIEDFADTWRSLCLYIHDNNPETQP